MPLNLDTTGTQSGRVQTFAQISKDEVTTMRTAFAYECGDKPHPQEHLGTIF
jgi:glucose dehydrogenase